MIKIFYISDIESKTHSNGNTDFEIYEEGRVVFQFSVRKTENNADGSSPRYEFLANENIKDEEDEEDEEGLFTKSFCNELCFHYVK